MNIALSCNDLTVRYGKAAAVSGVSLEFEAGVVHAVVGPNGAGKSSLLNALIGAVPSTGRVEVNGRDVSRTSTAERARLGLASVGQGRPIFPHLTVTENFEVAASILRLGGDVVEAALDRFPVLRERRRTPVGALSGGEQQMVMVARALMADCSVLLLDEAGTGLAPWVIQMILDLVEELRAAGTTTIISEPTVGRMVAAASHGVVMVRGSIVGRASGHDELSDAYTQALGLRPVGT